MSFILITTDASLSSASLRLAKNRHSTSFLQRPIRALRLCREGTQIHRQSAQVWPISCRRLGFCGRRNLNFSLRELAKGFHIAAVMSGRSPVLLFDVMGTIVRDPFYQDIPAFFGISLKELLHIKHPTAWVEFEKGLITEEELVAKFFRDKRSFDSNGLKTCVANGYAYLEGVEALLDRLKTNGYQMHAFTNYPSWYKLIEEKLELSKYLNWTFVSCHTGKRKPDPEAFVDAAEQLGLSPSDIIFIDDHLIWRGTERLKTRVCKGGTQNFLYFVCFGYPRVINVEAAIQIGMTGLTFQGAEKLESDLITLGIMV